MGRRISILHILHFSSADHAKGADATALDNFDQIPVRLSHRDQPLYGAFGIMALSLLAGDLIAK